MNQPPEGSLTPLPRNPVVLSKTLMKAVDAAPRLISLTVTWPTLTVNLMPVLIMHCVIPGMPVAGAN